MSYGQGRGGRAWRRLREQVFMRDAYLCVECRKLGELVLAEICDHIRALSQGGTDAMDNLQSLCKRCSDAKTHAESKGKAYVPKGCAADGTPAGGWD